MKRSTLIALAAVITLSACARPSLTEMRQGWADACRGEGFTSEQSLLTCMGQRQSAWNVRQEALGRSTAAAQLASPYHWQNGVNAFR